MTKFGARREDPRPSKTFAQRLRATRVAREFSQAGLAALMTEQGVPMSKVAVLRIENGARGITLDEALAFAFVLGAAPANLLSPEDGGHVWPTDRQGLSGAEFRNWLLFGDPLLVSEEGQRVRARFKAIFAIERLAQAMVDARRGDDSAGVNAAAKELTDIILKHQAEIAAIEGGEADAS